MQFRADVEGLRAVAILLVVAAHARVPGLDGGFVGVDVFFVLSGFLITGLLVHEVRSTRRVDLPAFYARRLRRLLPALAAMLATTAVAAVLLLAPLEQQPQVMPLGAAALWLSNFHFALSDVDYFGAAAESSLVLHTWSLGVEEQFYLFWPAFLMFLLPAGASPGGQLMFHRLKWGLIAALLVSLASSVALTYTAPRLAFYMMPARIWQFAAGALIFLHTGDRPLPNTRTTKAVGWAGLVLIVGTALLIDKQAPYPGLWAIAPTLGTALVLTCHARVPDAGVGLVLSWGALQRLGRVSYAWYLWHWPVLVLGATVVPAESLMTRVALAGLALGMAVVSYWLVEAPARRSPWWSSHPGTTISAAGATMLALCVLVSAWAHRLPEWGHSPEQDRFTAIRSDLPGIYALGCDDVFDSTELKPCAVGPGHAKNTAVILGDSVAVQWFPAIAPVFQNAGWRLVVLTKSACPMVDEPVFYASIGRRYTECEAWRAEAIRWVARARPQVLLIGSANSYPLEDSQWREGSQRVLADVSASAGHVFVIRGTPSLPFDGPGCLFRESWRGRFVSLPTNCVAQRSDAPQVFDQLQRAAAEYENVQLLDFNELVCPSGKCKAAQGSSVVFRDSQHVTASFIKRLSGRVEAALGPAIAAAAPPRSTTDAPVN